VTGPQRGRTTDSGTVALPGAPNPSPAGSPEGEGVKGYGSESIADALRAHVPAGDPAPVLDYALAALGLGAAGGAFDSE
jgi:hypothetical protein